ncbi:MAG TPA: hypothetical protein VGH52_07965 [Gaiellaceae bacterium]|jgi:hypothetical protein
MDRRQIALAASSALALGALGFVAAGCGGSSAAASATTQAATTTTGTGAASANFQKFQSCLQSKGVTIPAFRRPTGTNRTFTGTNRTFTGPRPGTGTTPRRTGAGFGGFGNLTAKQRAALTACQKLLPNNGQGGGFFGRARTGGGASNGAFAKYTQCLAKHGVKFGQQSAGSSAFAKAQAACRSLLPTPGTSTTTTTSSG